MTPSYHPTDGLDVALDDGILRITLDRPRTRNAMDDAMGHALIGHLVHANQDEAVRVVVLQGTGPDFCTGSDLTAKNAATGHRPRVGSIQRRLPSTFHRLVPLLLETQVPVVTAVRGWAAGLGFQLAIASDFCIAARSARFWEPFLARGFTPDSGATWLLPRLVGLSRARELLLLGREVGGAEAAEWGLVHAAVADEDVDDAVEELARTLAAGPTVALGLTKSLLHRAASADLHRHLADEAMALELSSRSHDFKEGLAAFRDRRDPRFVGR